MDLVLWRHAEAVDAQDAHGDLERALTPRGERQAQRMAGWLNLRLPPDAQVLVSPARRTQQTAAALDRRFTTVPALAPDAGIDALLQAVRWPAAREPVVVVGHQPTLGLTAAWLLSAQTSPWTIRKAGVWWLRARDRAGQLQVVLHAVVSPDLV